jgi:hypothetical protein
MAKKLNANCNKCELLKEKFCNGTFQKGTPNCERFEDYHYERSAKSRRK